MKRLLSRVRLLLIGVALLLSGCSALRLAYDNGTQLAWWWLDGYLDFPAAAAPQVKEHIGGWFGWHRETQLADYADWLARLQARALKPITPAQACSLNDDLRARLQPAVERAIAVAAELVPSLGPEQIRHLEERMRKANLELRDEFAHSDPAERRDRAVRRAIDRFERFYGRLGEAQRKVIAARVLSSPFDPEAWIAERERRQADTLRALRQLQAERAAPAQAATDRLQLRLRRRGAQRRHRGAAAPARLAVQGLGGRPAPARSPGCRHSRHGRTVSPGRRHESQPWRHAG